MSRTAAVKHAAGRRIDKELAAHGIIARARSRKGLAEEQPAAYKDVDLVVDVVHQAGPVQEGRPHAADRRDQGISSWLPGEMRFDAAKYALIPLTSRCLLVQFALLDKPAVAHESTSTLLELTPRGFR